jgi:predicted transcriptional regulator
MKLKEYLEKQSITHKNFGKMIGVSQPFVTCMVSGIRIPSLTLMQRIIESTNGEVNVGDFFNHDTPSKQRSEKDKKTENT